MVKRSQLKQQLDARKGRDYAAEKQKKMRKAAEKRKQEKQAGNEEEDELDGSEESGEEDVEGILEELSALGSAKSTANGADAASDDEDAEEEEEDDEDEEALSDDASDVALSDLSEEDKQDIIPHQRLTINNSAAIKKSIARLTTIKPTTPFSDHNSLVSSVQLNVEDPNDDLTRELAFYKISLDAAKSARKLYKKENVPFTRPADYFAEMVKSDEHMGRVKKKLYEEAASKKASSEAKKQRDLKKFGKQVQNAKLQERAKEKREMLDKVNSLKRKRGSTLTTGKTNPNDTTAEDLFDVGLEDGPSSTSRDKSHSGNKRAKKDAKFGFGGKKRFSKSGDALSSGDMSGFSVRKMKGGNKAKTGAARRPGKSRRTKF